MRATHTRSWRLSAIATLAMLLTVGATATMTASAAAPAPPINDNDPFVAIVCDPAACKAPPAPPTNDNYLESLNLNKPGTALNRTETLSDTRNTQAATVQSDIFSPPSHGGPPELTAATASPRARRSGTTSIPNANGLVRIRTSAAFGTVMAVMPYNPKTLLPENSQRHVRGQPAHGGRRTVRRSPGREVVHDPDRGGRRSRGHGSVPVRLPRPTQAPAGRSDARRTAAGRRSTRGEPRRQRAPQGPRRSALHAWMQPPGEDGTDRTLPRLGGAVLPRWRRPEDLRDRQEQDRRLHRIPDRARGASPRSSAAWLRARRSPNLRMTLSSRGRVAIAALIVALAFGAAFAVRKATRRPRIRAAARHRSCSPRPPVHASGVALPRRRCRRCTVRRAQPLPLRAPPRAPRPRLRPPQRPPHQPRPPHRPLRRAVVAVAKAVAR